MDEGALGVGAIALRLMCQVLMSDENAVVTAGSVVTKDVPPNTLDGGNPAKVIRSIGE